MEHRDSIRTRFDPLGFLDGGGEMGERTRAFDWSSSPLGPPEHWPASLKTVIRILLGSRYAMWLGWGPDFTFFYNDAYARMTLGAKHPWALGRSAREVWSEIWSDIGPRAESVMRTGEATWDEGLLLFLERSGFPEETYHTFSYSPVPDDGGGIGGMLCVVTEDTERTLGQRRLALLRELAAQSTSDARTAEDACRHAARILDSHREDVPFALIYLLDETGHRATLAAAAGVESGSPLAPPEVALETGTGPWPFAEVERTRMPVVLDGPVSVPMPGGTWPEPSRVAIVLPVAKPARDHLAGFLVTGISPRRPLDDAYRGFLDILASQAATTIASARAHEEQVRRADALAELDRAKTAFFSNVSHEFRTPLTLMLGPLEELLGPGSAAVTPDARTQLEVVNRNGLRLMRLVNTLLDFSRLEAGRMRATFRPTDLAQLTADLASVFRTTIEKAGLRLDVDCPALPAPVFVDRSMWEKVLLNLLSNAFKFTFDGTIAVGLRANGNTVELTVSDTGTGIPASELPKLFDRFHRVENARGRTFEGSGIGLSLVDEIVRIHGGRVGVESVPGVGSTFRVTLLLGSGHLPAGQVEAAREADATPGSAAPFVEEALRWLPAAAAVDAPAPAGLPADRPLVLLVDDSADMRTYIARILSPHYRISAAADGVEALADARRRLPDLVLSDVMMPNLDGFGLLAALRADAALRHLPVVLLSARAGEESRVEGMDAGADDYLVKPFSARELLARVATHLRMAQRRREYGETLGRAERFQAGQKRVLQMVATGAPLDDVLATVVALIEEQDPRLIGSIVMPLPDGVRARIAAGPSLDAACIAALEGAPIEPPYLDPCSMALHRGQTVSAPDIASDARWPAQWRTLAAQHGLAAATSMPVFGTDGAILAVFGIYCRETGDAMPESRELMQVASHLVRIAVERHQAATDLAQQIQAIRQADRRKDEFLATLAHELRNPLAPIRNGLEIMRIAPRDAAAVERARSMVERQVGQMVRLVDDLLDLSRISRGVIELRRERVKLLSVLQNAVETSRPLFAAAGNELVIRVPPDPIEVDVDVTRLAQVFANLLNNAAKFTHRGGRIELSVTAMESGVSVSVKDDGSGIPAEMLPLVFDMFTQVDRDAQRTQGGLGIGLHIVRRLVEMHDGTVDAYSDGLGRGSEFIVRLPTVASARESARRGDPDPARTVRSLRILVVDDNREAATSLATILEIMGHETRVAHDAADALALAEAFRPEIGFLDIGLPQVDGNELCRRIRAQPWGRAPMLIALTGWGQAEDKQRSHEAGFDRHLVKPIDPSNLGRLLAG